MSIASKPFELERKRYGQIKFISPNLYELRKIAETLKISSDTFFMKSDLKVENVTTTDEKRRLFGEIIELCNGLQEHIDNIVVTAGNFGVVVQRLGGDEGAFFTSNLSYIVGKRRGRGSCRHYPGKAVDKIVNASGAGDAFCAGFISGMLKNKPEAICISVGFQAAFSALMSKRAVPKTFFGSDHECWKTPAGFERLTRA